MAWVWEYSKTKGSELLTMLAIANCADQYGDNAFPSIKRLAKDTRISERQVSRLVRRLERQSEIVVDQSKGRHANVYQIAGMAHLANEAHKSNEANKAHKSNKAHKANLDKMSGLKSESPNPDISSKSTAINPDILNPDKSSTLTQLCRPNPDIAMSYDPSLIHQERDNTDPNGSVLHQKLTAAKKALAKSKTKPKATPKPEPKPEAMPSPNNTSQPKSRNRQPPDPRCKHPALEMVRSIRSRWPDKVVWDDIIKVLGDAPDRERLVNCYKLQVELGCNPNSLPFIFEFYPPGGLEERRRQMKRGGNGKNGVPEKDRDEDYWKRFAFKQTVGNWKN